jgi:predicted kinase
VADAAASLLAELSPRLRAAIDTSVFARLEPSERDAVERLAYATGSHVVAYDLRITGAGLALCATVRQADLDPDQLGALRAVERELAPWIALVAYARPAELRRPEEIPSCG